MTFRSSFLVGISAVVAVANVSLAKEGTTIVGPFVPGTGYWTTVPNGGFETGDVSEWSDFLSSNGVFRASDEMAFLGNYSAKALPARSFDGPGFALQQGITVQPGETYVISAFIYNEDVPDGQLYLDNYPTAMEWGFANPGVGNNHAEWQFSWVDVTVPEGLTTMNVRVVLDALIDQNDYGYVDEVAVTLVADFVPPTPEPTSVVMLVLGGVVLVRQRKRLF